MVERLTIETYRFVSIVILILITFIKLVLKQKKDRRI